MKRYLLLLFVFASCGSTESNIKSAIRTMEKERLVSQDGSVESIDIENLSYKTVSLRDYYSEKHLSILENWADIVKLRLDMLHLGSPQNIDSIRAENEKHDRMDRELDSLSKYSDSTQNIYEVEYILKAITPKKSYDNKEKEFIYQKDLKVVNPAP